MSWSEVTVRVGICDKRRGETIVDAPGRRWRSVSNGNAMPPEIFAQATLQRFMFCGHGHHDQNFAGVPDGQVVPAELGNRHSGGNRAALAGDPATAPNGKPSERCRQDQKVADTRS